MACRDDSAARRKANRSRFREIREVVGRMTALADWMEWFKPTCGILTLWPVDYERDCRLTVRPTSLAAIRTKGAGFGGFAIFVTHSVLLSSSNEPLAPRAGTYVSHYSDRGCSGAGSPRAGPFSGFRKGAADTDLESR
jgi:hypothetical protein